MTTREKQLVEKLTRLAQKNRVVSIGFRGRHNRKLTSPDGPKSGEDVVNNLREFWKNSS
jgi:hypothetical protein